MAVELAAAIDYAERLMGVMATLNVDSETAHKLIRQAEIEKVVRDETMGSETRLSEELRRLQGLSRPRKSFWQRRRESLSARRQELRNQIVA